MRVEIEDHEEAEFLASLLKVARRSAADRENRPAIKLFDAIIKKLEHRISPRLNEEETLVCQTVLQTMRTRLEQLSPEEVRLLDALTLSLQPKQQLAS